MVAAMNSDDVIGGKYRLDRVIAEGGMAVVWRATDIQLRREVAVKMLKPNIASDEVVAERFRREAIALAQLHHKHIMPVYDCIDEDGQVATARRTAARHRSCRCTPRCTSARR
jgi:serine/threonine-protein kinase